MEKCFENGKFAVINAELEAWFSDFWS